MKRLEIIVKPKMLDVLQNVLDEGGAHGVMVSSIQGYGNQKGNKSMYRGSEMEIKMLPKIKVETVLEDDKVKEMTEKIVKAISTGDCGDGKIFVYAVTDAVRIRTGEHGEKAL